MIIHRALFPNCCAKTRPVVTTTGSRNIARRFALLEVHQYCPASCEERAATFLEMRCTAPPCGLRARPVVSSVCSDTTGSADPDETSTALASKGVMTCEKSAETPPTGVKPSRWYMGMLGALLVERYRVASAVSAAVTATSMSFRQMPRPGTPVE